MNFATDGNVETMGAGVADNAINLLKHGVTATTQFGCDLHVRYGHGQVDHRYVGSQRGVDIVRAHAAPGDGPQRKPGIDDGLDRCDFFEAHRWGANLGLSYARLSERGGDGDLLAHGEGDARSLLPVTQRCIVEDDWGIRGALIKHGHPPWLGRSRAGVPYHAAWR